MGAGGGDLERAPRMVLAADISEVGQRMRVHCRRGGHGRRQPAGVREMAGDIEQVAPTEYAGGARQRRLGDVPAGNHQRAPCPPGRQ